VVKINKYHSPDYNDYKHLQVTTSTQTSLSYHEYTKL